MSTKKQLILLVDDDEDLLRVMKDSLSEAGYDIATAVDGVTAWEAFKNGRPDAVVCDVEMPNVDGFEFCLKFRESPDNADVPFIFLTAFDSKDRERQARMAGADDFLVKPFDMVELLIMVKTRITRIQQIRNRTPKN